MSNDPIFTTGQRRRTLLASQVVAMRNGHLATKMFQTWKLTYQKHANVKQWQEKKLMARYEKSLTNYKPD